MASRVLVLAGILLLAACGGPKSDEREQVSGAEVADKLDAAAAQSSPEARAVLSEAADAARTQPSMAPVDKPDSFAQDAMRRAGEAEASASPGR